MAITTLELSKQCLMDLSTDITKNSIADDSSAFASAIFAYCNYLAEATNLTDDQKAGSMASFIRESYSETNRQSYQIAMDFLKTNAELCLKIDETNANVCLTEKRALSEVENTCLIKCKLDTEAQNKCQSEAASKAANLKVYQELSILCKQYGMSITSTNGVVSAVADDANNEGIIDKQIKGYDIINYKDLLKTSDEKAALMMNAKIPETLNQKMMRVIMVWKISGLRVDGFIHSGPDNNNVQTKYTVTIASGSDGVSEFNALTTDKSLWTANTDKATW